MKGSIQNLPHDSQDDFWLTGETQASCHVSAAQTYILFALGDVMSFMVREVVEYRPRKASRQTRGKLFYFNQCDNRLT